MSDSFITAVDNNDIATVTTMVSAGIDVNCVDKVGYKLNYDML
jgi:hypothetical protein